MQQMEHSNIRPDAERQRVEAVVETLANLRSRGETVAEVAHDARNMVTALGLYCDLLEEPGVLATPFSHYGNELRLVAAASRRLVEKLVEIDHRSIAEVPVLPTAALDTRSFTGSLPSPFANVANSGTATTGSATSGLLSASSTAMSPFATTPRSPSEYSRIWDLMPAAPIDNLAAELLANRNLLSSLAGPAIALTADTDGGARPVRLTGEDLTRVLINLVKNAAEALPGGGRIQIALREQQKGARCWLAMTVEDNGDGILEENLEHIFSSGFSVATRGASDNGGWPSTHRGLGLAITRSIVEAAGGSITAANRSQGGARFTIELPVTE